MKQAMFYEKRENSKVRCCLCPHECVLSVGATGLCRSRRNEDGQLYSLNYACVASAALDPIEKKPLYHFHPGTLILSVGTFGCNFKCGYCQNWSIAHTDVRTMKMMPEELADLAAAYVRKGNIGVAYTYNEPTIWIEFVLEASRLVRQRGLMNVLVTNGFISPGPLEELLPLTDAMNIDVKAFSEGFYEKYCKGTLADVKKTVERAAQSCHVEITTLIIPGLNDSPEEIGQLAQWLSTINPEIVLHLSRFFPNYRMNDIPPTPRSTLENARESVLQYLPHVYLGNI
jgi:pyruvate formate lyase activating enzyme